MSSSQRKLDRIILDLEDLREDARVIMGDLDKAIELLREVHVIDPMGY